MDYGTRIVIPLMLVTFFGISKAENNAAAMAYYENEQYAQAAALFDDYHWKALALAKSNQLRGAQMLLSQLDDVDAQYNLGLVLAHQGLLSLSLEAFQAVLEIEPNAEDARRNAEILSALLLNRAEEGASGSGREQQSQKRDASEEGEGSGSGASGEQQSDSEQMDSPQGQSSDIEAAKGGTNSADAPRESSNQSTQSQSSLEGEVGNFESKSQRAAIGGEDEERGEDGEHSLNSRSSELEEQALTQWFNRIQHNQAQFMRERLELMSLSRKDVLGEEEVR